MEIPKYTMQNIKNVNQAIEYIKRVYNNRILSKVRVYLYAIPEPVTYENMRTDKLCKEMLKLGGRHEIFNLRIDE